MHKKAYATVPPAYITYLSSSRSWTQLKDDDRINMMISSAVSRSKESSSSSQGRIMPKALWPWSEIQWPQSSTYTENFNPQAGIFEPLHWDWTGYYYLFQMAKSTKKKSWPNDFWLFLKKYVTSTYLTERVIVNVAVDWWCKELLTIKVHT